jgi:hypothetical protein
MVAAEDAAGIARRLVGEQFPDARAAWLGGSVVRGDATETSDLDITVVLPGPPAPFRDSIRYAGWPVELFVHTEDSLTLYRQKDRDRRQPTIMRLVGESIILVDTDGIGVSLQHDCVAEIAAGPVPLSGEALASARYGVTDLITDLEGSTDDAERAAISTILWQDAARLLLAATGSWTAFGKGLVRELRRFDAARSTTYTADLMEGMRNSIAGDPQHLITLCDGILEQFGGRLFEGHRLGGETPSA